MILCILYLKLSAKQTLTSSRLISAFTAPSQEKTEIHIMKSMCHLFCLIDKINAIVATVSNEFTVTVEVIFHGKIKGKNGNLLKAQVTQIKQPKYIFLHNP